METVELEADDADELHVLLAEYDWLCNRHLGDEVFCQLIYIDD